MTDTHEHDLVHGAIWGGVLAAGGAAVRALQTPQTWRTFAACVSAGLLFGAIATVMVLWQYAAVPFEVALMAGAFVGFVSTHLSQMVVKVTDKLFDKMGGEAEKRIDGFNVKSQGTATDGPLSTPHPSGPDSGKPK